MQVENEFREKRIKDAELKQVSIKQINLKNDISRLEENAVAYKEQKEFLDKLDP